MPEDRKEREILIPEVLPPEREPFEPPPSRRPRTGKARRIFGPILAGALIDAIDFVTMGVTGLVIGGIAAFWALGQIGVRLPTRFMLSIAAACYCALPFRRFLPIATIIGAMSQFFDRDRDR